MLKKAAFYTLGCKVNQTETEMVEGLFQDAGFEIVDYSDIADVYVINTCTVTASADRKSRQMIRRALQSRETKDNTVIVMGCYAQASSEDILQALDVDLVLGNTHRANVIDYLKQYQLDGKKKAYADDILLQKEFEEISSKRHITRTRAFVKIQEGCQQFCTYCIIPYTRGPSRSRKPKDVLAEVRELEDQGFKEIVLTGIHIGSYGLDFPRETVTENMYRLSDLITDILKVTSRLRIRISSVEPGEVTPELMDVVAGQDRVCDHLHIPLQSGSDPILQAMNRPYDTNFYRKTINNIRALVPEIAITTDIMVGFPGETEQDASDTLDFAESIQFSDIHVFSYSPREHTPAADFPDQVIKKDKEIRSASLIRLASGMKQDFLKKCIGKTMDVLFEQEESESAEGHTSSYLKVRVNQKISKNEYRKVYIEAVEKDVLIGKVL